MVVIVRVRCGVEGITILFASSSHFWISTNRIYTKTSAIHPVKKLNRKVTTYCSHSTPSATKLTVDDDRRVGIPHRDTNELCEVGEIWWPLGSDRNSCIFEFHPVDTVLPIILRVAGLYTVRRGPPRSHDVLEYADIRWRDFFPNRNDRPIRCLRV